MASGDETRKKDQKLAESNMNTANERANKQLQTTPEQGAVNTFVGGVLHNKGDYADNPNVNWNSGMSAYLKNESAKKNRGAYTMGAQYANPDLLAAEGKQEEAQAAQQDALALENTVGGARNQALGMGLQSAGLTADRIGSTINPAVSMANSFGGNAANLASQGGFWKAFTDDAIRLATAGGGSAAAGGATKVFGL